MAASAAIMASFRGSVSPVSCLGRVDVAWMCSSIRQKDHFSALCDQIRQAGGVPRRSSWSCGCRAHSARCHQHETTVSNIGQIDPAGVNPRQRSHAANNDLQDVLQVGSSADFTYDVFDVSAHRDARRGSGSARVRDGDRSDSQGAGARICLLPRRCGPLCNVTTHRTALRRPRQTDATTE
jgi:hypothetical protein